MSTKIFLYDTTLRDGAQSEEVNLSATDKVRIARQLDYLGMDYICLLYTSHAGLKGLFQRFHGLGVGVALGRGDHELGGVVQVLAQQEFRTLDAMCIRDSSNTPPLSFPSMGSPRGIRLRGLLSSIRA